MIELPQVREQHGFTRTVCGCAKCTVFCRHLPGDLDPADLPRLCPPGRDLLEWAEEHLRARVGRPFPTLIPARQANGHCHWLFDGQCAVHAASPYGCAFFDAHMTAEEVAKRGVATHRAREEDAAEQGPYWRVWTHLCRKGLTSAGGDRQELATDYGKVLRTAERQRRRVTDDR